MNGEDIYSNITLTVTSDPLNQTINHDTVSFSVNSGKSIPQAIIKPKLAQRLHGEGSIPVSNIGKK
jgi:hypothetical protein